MDQGAKCESSDSPARPETLHTPGSFLHRNWEISAAPGKGALNAAAVIGYDACQQAFGALK